MKGLGGKELEFKQDQEGSAYLLYLAMKFCVHLKKDGASVEEAIILIEKVWDLMMANGIEHSDDFVNELADKIIDKE